LMPLKKQDTYVLTSGKIISVFLEDLPFLYIQYAVLNDAGTDDAGTRLASLLALIFSLASIFVALVSWTAKFGSDYKSLRKTYVLIRNPKDSLLRHTKSMLKHFENNGFHDSYAWITVSQQSETDFRLCFEYTHVPNTNLENAILEAVIPFSTDETEIAIEMSPKAEEFIEDVNELAVLLGFKSGRVHLGTTKGEGEEYLMQLELQASENSIRQELREMFGDNDDIDIESFVNYKLRASVIDSPSGRKSNQIILKKGELTLRHVRSKAEEKRYPNTETIVGGEVFDEIELERMRLQSTNSNGVAEENPDETDSSDGFPISPSSLVSKISAVKHNYVARDSTIELIKKIQSDSSELDDHENIISPDSSE